MMKNHVIANFIQSPFECSSSLWRIACGGTENIWTSGNDTQLYQIDNKSGAVLKNVKAANDVPALSIDSDQNVVFIVSWPDKKVYKYEVKQTSQNTVEAI